MGCGLIVVGRGLVVRWSRCSSWVTMWCSWVTVPRLWFLRHAGGSSWWLDVVVVVWVAVDVVGGCGGFFLFFIYFFIFLLLIVVVVDLAGDCWLVAAMVGGCGCGGCGMGGCGRGGGCVEVFYFYYIRY